MTRITVVNIDPPCEADAESRESILGALLRSGVDVPHCCRRGTCGMCASVLLSGEFERIEAHTDDPRPFQPPAGQILICKSRALTHCTIRPVHTLRPTQAGMRWAVDMCRLVGSSTVHLRIAAPTEGSSFQFRAGQRARLEIGPAYAASPLHLFIASRPGISHIDFYLPLDDLGQLMLEGLRAQDEVVLHEPVGSCSLSDDEAQPAVIIAERAGLASALGMIEMLAARNRERAAWVFLVGSDQGVVERLAMAKARRAGIPVALLSDRGELHAAMGTALASQVRQAQDVRVRGCVKASRETVKIARAALLEIGVRPWDIQVDNVE